MATLDMMLKGCPKIGMLPLEGDFLRLFEWTDEERGTVKNIEAISAIVSFTGSHFYVSKEILCVLENFKMMYQSEFTKDTLCVQQFILVGSSGAGKSCILALICFCIAVLYKRPVVWWRQSYGYQRTVTRLFLDDKYYEWEDSQGRAFNELCDAVQDEKAWFCIDELSEKELVPGKDWPEKVRLLAVTGDFTPTKEGMRSCLVPFWKKRDLIDFGRHLRMEEDDIDARYFVSGGNVRTFSSDFAKQMVHVAIECVSLRDAHSLRTWFGDRSDKGVDRVRMRGVADYCNTNHYMDPSKLTWRVSSRLALQYLSPVMDPRFFEKLMELSQGLDGDDDRQEIAFEGYFHSLMRQQNTVSLHWCKYGNAS